MAGKWQLWYPHKIDAWQGSATIQTFTDAAYRGFHNLIMEQFQAEDGMLPDDDLQLARMSRLGVRWEQVKHEVRPALTSNGSGRIYSATQFHLWQDASARHDAYIGRMTKARAIRDQHKAQANGLDKPFANPLLTHNTVDGQTETKTKKERKNKDSGAADARAAEFKAAFQDTFAVENSIPAPWDAKEATNLKKFLAANPTIVLEQWRRILYHRSISPINHKASLSVWISRALAWLDAPADEWGKPLKGAPALPSQPVAISAARSEVEQYLQWASMSAAFKTANPWIGPIPTEVQP
jgi:hypothetical protein